MKVLVVIFGAAFFFIGLELVQRMQILRFVKSPPLVNCDALNSNFDE